MLTIQKITASETIPVRHPVLRKGKNIESCAFDGDELLSTLHFGLFESEEIVGVVSVFEKSHPFFKETSQAQIRGMAILESHQKKGFGKLLLDHCEKELKKGTISLIWFNARENAVAFYKKMDYHIIGNSFEIDGIGTHYVMYKKVKD